MKIGEVATKAGVNVQTLRYYERRGLLREPARLRSGYRTYSADTVQVVRFVKQAQALGFTLDDANELLRLARGGPGACGAVRTLASTKVDEFDRKIGMLRAMRRALQRLVATCRPTANAARVSAPRGPRRGGLVKVELFYHGGCPTFARVRGIVRDCLTRLGLAVEVEEHDGDFPSPCVSMAWT